MLCGPQHACRKAFGHSLDSHQRLWLAQCRLVYVPCQLVVMGIAPQHQFHLSPPFLAQVKEWMHRSSGVPMEELERHMFLLRDRDATQHLMEVSGGLDSLIKGEGQILAQVRAPRRAFGDELVPAEHVTHSLMLGQNLAL